MLWDVGAGSGAVGIEWLRAAAGAAAFAIESDPARWEDIKSNADNLGVPDLLLIKGSAPAAFATIPSPPDAVFVGGGLSQPGLLETCLGHLKPGGRLVANAVTLESQEILTRLYREHGGELTRVAVSRSGPVGDMTALRPLMDVLQWAVVKP